MATKNRPTEESRRQAMFERLRYFVWVARRDPKALTLQEIDELCQYVVALAPKKRPPTRSMEVADAPTTSD